MAKRVSGGKRLTVEASRTKASPRVKFGPTCSYLVLELRIVQPPRKRAPRKK
jgi:hypothetical protein